MRKNPRKELTGNSRNRKSRDHTSRKAPAINFFHLTPLSDEAPICFGALEIEGCKVAAEGGSFSTSSSANTVFVPFHDTPPTLPESNASLSAQSAATQKLEIPTHW
jgi:hypothetical protein